MYPQFEHPCAARRSLRIDLSFRKMPEVLEQAKKSPSARPYARVASATNQHEPIDRKTLRELLWDPSVNAGKRLIALTARTRINQSIAFNSIVVGVFLALSCSWSGRKYDGAANAPAIV